MKICLNLPANSYKFYKVSKNQKLDTVPISFYVRNDENEVFITGNISALGNWQPTEAPAMDSWNGEMKKVNINCPINTELEIKLIKKDANGIFAWEPGDNHVVKMKNRDGSFKITWSKPEIEELQKVKIIIKDAKTEWGENVYIAGNITELGKWNTDNAVGPALCPNYPEWEICVDLPCRKLIEWKALKNGKQKVSCQNKSNQKITINDLSDDIPLLQCNW